MKISPLMSTAPQSPFEGVAIVRLHPLVIVVMALIALIVATFVLLTPWWAHLTIEAGYWAAETLRLATETGQPDSAPPFRSPAFSSNFLLGLWPFLPLWIAFFSGARRMTRLIPVSIGVRDDHLLVNGESVGLRSVISAAFIIPGEGDSRTVRLERPRRPAIQLRVQNEEHAAALLRALGLGASYPLSPQRGGMRVHIGMGLTLGVMLVYFVVLFETVPRLITSWVVGRLPPAPSMPSTFSAATANAMSHAAGHMAIVSGVETALYDILLPVTHIMLPVALVIIVIWIWRAFEPRKPRLVVGTDGISLVFRGRPRFEPFENIANVEVKKSAISIALTTGEPITFTVESNAQEIADRIRTAKARGCAA